MSETPRIDGIEIEEDSRFERWIWVFERVGWVLMALAILAALAGLFGKGPLSSASIGSPDGPFHLRYDRFARFEAPLKLQFDLKPREDGQAQLWLSRDYLHTVRIEQIEPEPDTPQSVEDGVVFSFPVTGQEVPVRITIFGVAESMGKHAGRAGPSPGEVLDFWQFVYP